MPLNEQLGRSETRMRTSPAARVDHTTLDAGSEGVAAAKSADLTDQEWQRIVAKIRSDFTDTVATFQSEK